MEIKKCQNSQVFTGKIGNVDLFTNSDAGIKIIEAVDKFLPRVKNIGDNKTKISLEVDTDTLFVNCEQTFVPQKNEIKGFISKLANKLKFNFQKPIIIEESSMENVAFINSADDIEFLAKNAHKKCLESSRVEKFNLCK